MTKRKKEPQKENRVTIKMSNGKVTKAKNKEIPLETPSKRKIQVKLARTPLVQRQSTRTILPQEIISDTNTLGKCLPKWTSTPLNMGNKPADNQFRLDQLIRTNLKYNNNLSAPERPPLSPILGDISNLINNNSSNVSKNNNSIEGVDKNKNRDFASSNITDRASRAKLRLGIRAQENANTNRTELQNCPKSIPSSSKFKVFERDPISNNTGRITRRRSVGVPKVAQITKTNDLLEVPSKYKNNKCNKLRVRLSRSSLGTSNPLLNVSSAKKSNDTVTPNTNKRPKSALHDPKDVSFVKCLRDDWSTTSLNDTLSQIQQIRDEIVPLRADKRQLSPLIELSSYESSLSKKSQAKTSANEDDYSSSAEFESDNEMENSRSKRAPTWKDLSNKSAKSASRTLNQLSPHHLHKSPSMKVRLRRLRIHTKSRTQDQNGVDGSVSNNKDTEVISGNKRNDKEGSKNLKDVNKEVPSQEMSIKQVHINNPSEEPAATESVVSPSQNLLNKSDLIEQILSSPDVDDQHVQPNDKTNLNCTRKFFHSHRDNTVAVAKTVETPKRKRTSARNKKKTDSIYEFLSQSSSDSIDPVADVIQKMINNGKVVVAKHKKGTGKLVVPRRKRKVATKKKFPKSDDVFARPNSPPQPPPVKKADEPLDNALPFDDGGVDEEPVRDQRGFSKLARSAMIKHAGKSDNTSQRKIITDKQQLLAMAQKFVGQSTPVRISSPSTSNATAAFSPIPGGSSPWRVDDDKLPHMFYFNRNSDNLPSYSSDYIPSTPSKNKSKSSSSFSSNDSNGENVAPPSAPSPQNPTQISSNPRRALSYRSPLKAINILEVINLPPLAVDRSEKDALEEMNNRDKSKKSGVNAINANVSNLFGFEDMIEDDEDDIDITHQPLNAGKINLKEQLQRLKRLRTEMPKATASGNNRIEPVFDNERQKQKTLQQMFCSTMIERQSLDPNDGVVEKTYFNGTGDGDLFKDPDPETTFVQSTARRSYSRPFKRKRKLRHNFVMFMDSDASEEEDDDEVAAKNQRKKVKERNKKSSKENLELKKFVNDFNEMYKEVSEYELIVE